MSVSDAIPADALQLEEEQTGSTTIGALWFVVIAFMFFAQHHTCDAYFVPAINVFADKMRASPNAWLRRWGQESVAGATICALGCNGPELFSNLIALYTGSDAGIGVVVGSEIFNLLVIIGCSVIVAPIVPLHLERIPFTRDCIAYAISIVLLYGALRDRVIQFNESMILFGAAIGYVAAVYFTQDFEDWLQGAAKASVASTESTPTSQGQIKRGNSFTVQPGTPSGSVKVPHMASIHGVQVEVEEIYHGRIVDGHHTAPHGMKVSATESGIYTKELDPKKGFQLESADGALLGPKLAYDNLKEVIVMGFGVIELEFEKGFMGGFLLEHITLKLTAATTADRDELLESIKANAGLAWVHRYDATVKGSWEHLKHSLADKDLSVFLKIFFCMPEFLIDSVLRITLFKCDVKDITKENRWPVCFLGAMMWLAFFSYCMLECANAINANIPAIPTSFLGITVCAVGTSFPNAVASVILSQQNKPAAAIANALGSNVQNVFLAMALPWIIYSANYNFQDIPQNVAGIQEGILWMVGTLVLVVIFVLIPPGFCALTTTYGWILNAVYLVYVIITMGETFGWWPPLIK